MTFGWLSFLKMKSEKRRNGMETTDWSVLDKPIKDLVPPISSRNGKSQKMAYPPEIPIPVIMSTQLAKSNLINYNSKT